MFISYLYSNTIIDICCDGGGEVIDPEEEEATTEEGEIDEEEVVEEGEEDTELTPEIPDVTPCPVCTGGLTVDGSTGAGGGNTCDDLLADAQQVDESSDECTAMKEAESRCCPPPPQNPCSVCSGGLTVDESVGLGGGRTCGGLLIDASNTEEDSDVCTQMKSVEETCCPALVENREYIIRVCAYCIYTLLMNGFISCSLINNVNVRCLFSMCRLCRWSNWRGC